MDELADTSSTTAKRAAEGHEISAPWDAGRVSSWIAFRRDDPLECWNWDGLDPAALASAEVALTAAVRSEQIFAWGHRCDVRGTLLPDRDIEQVPAHIFRSVKQPRTINAFSRVDFPEPISLEDLLRSDGPFFAGLMFDSEEIRKVWPLQNAELAKRAPEPMSSAVWMTADEAMDHWIEIRRLHPDSVSAAHQAAAALIEVWAAGTLEVFGVPDGAVGRPDPKAEPKRVPVEIFTLRALAVRNNRLEAGSAGSMNDFMLARRPLYSNLTVRRADLLRIWPTTTLELQTVPPPTFSEAKTRSSRRFTGLDYRDADATLVAEMRSLITDGKACSATNAARAVVSRAKGNGKDDSKVARLVALYGKTYG